MRLRQYLKLATCRITETEVIAKIPPTTSSSSSTFIMIAIAAIAPPRANEPVSARNTSAGKALNQRKPIAAPNSAAPKNATSRRIW
jgi:hypothetical protein